MELRHLRYFVAVAEELNFTRAAVRVGIGQPPLSQQIRDLEDELGTALFLRTPHGVKLTEAGHAFLREARVVLAGAAQAKSVAQRAGRGESGSLRIGFTGSLSFNTSVPGIIRDFSRAWPDVGLHLEEANTMHLLDRLMKETLDAVFIRPGKEALPGIQLSRFADEPMCIALPAHHRLANRKSIALIDLADEAFVLFARGAVLSLYDEIVNVCRHVGFEPKVHQTAPQMTSVVNLVAAELGVSIVTSSMCQVRVKGVRYVDIKGPAPCARLALATRVNDATIVVRNLMTLAASHEGYQKEVL